MLFCLISCYAAIQNTLAIDWWDHFETFSLVLLSRGVIFLKKILLQIADRLNVPTRPKARELLPLSCQNWVLLIARYAQLFK